MSVDAIFGGAAEVAVELGDNAQSTAEALFSIPGQLYGAFTGTVASLGNNAETSAVAAADAASDAAKAAALPVTIATGTVAVVVTSAIADQVFNNGKAFRRMFG